MSVTVVYGSPKWVIHKELLEDLGGLAQNIQAPWLIVGDFNALLNDDDKQWGLDWIVFLAIFLINLLMIFV